MDTEAPEHDVVVVGARCAGAATAMLFADQGLDVLVVDRADLPSDTLSTHSLSRGALVQLDRWSLLDDVVASGAPQVRTIAFHAVGDQPQVRPVHARAGIDHLLAPRRHILDAILLDGARQAGATVQTEINVTGVTRAADGRVDGVTLRDADGAATSVSARLVVGADGVRSRIARAVDAAVIDERPPSGASHYLYVTGLGSEGYEFHLGHTGLAGVFRTHGGEAVVWICAPRERDLRDRPDKVDGFLDLLAEIAPALATRVRHATITAPVRSAVGMPNHVLAATGPGWALVGDAGYHRDPITGHGITDAFRDAELLAYHLGRALRGDDHEAAARASYETQRWQQLLPVFDATMRLGAFPDRAEFIQLQRALSSLFEDEATWLASRPYVPLAQAIAA